LKAIRIRLAAAGRFRAGRGRRVRALHLNSDANRGSGPSSWKAGGRDRQSL